MTKPASSCRNRMLAAAVALAALPAVVAGAQAGQSRVTCSNPVSGASWQIRIDDRNSTVDSYPARIGRTAISWFDPKDGGHYTLDRNTGDLTASVASSTGGYFRHGHCDVGKPR